MLRLFLTCLFVGSAVTANAQEQDYLDDRSTPSALVSSLYNAIDRAEYARAWSYFSAPPASDVDSYAEGYAQTERIELITGTPHEEGAAGSIYFQLPVAILSHGTDGSQQVYAGCYTLRMADPTIGEEFEPLHIERGSLNASDSPFGEALPRSCNGTELPEHDALLERAKAIFASSAPAACLAEPALGDADRTPESYTISFRYRHDDAGQPERTARLFRFFCMRGAYNETHLYYISNDDGDVEPLHFARPQLDIAYADEDTNEEVDSITVTGFSTAAQLVNSSFDPQAQTISEFSRWRGMGDASSAGVWAFYEGGFRLVHYEVDASYDGEVNPEVLVDYGTTP